MERDYSISAIRVFAMPMIVFYHCLCYNLGVWSWFENVGSVYSPLEAAFIRNIAYVGLDAFVFISGMLYLRIGNTGKYDNIRHFVTNKASRLIIPYSGWGILQCFIFYGFEKPTNLLYGSEHLWFLLMLFEVFIIAALSKPIWDRMGFKASVIGFFFLLLIDWGTNKVNVLPRDEYGRSLLCLQTALKYLPIFYMGMLCEKFKIYEKIKVRVQIVPFLVIVLFIIGALFTYISLPVAWAYRWMPNVLMLLFCYKALKESHLDALLMVGGGKSKVILLNLDKYSLSIYIIHHILIWSALFYLPNVASMIHEHYIIAPIMMFVMVVPISLGLSCVIAVLPKAKCVIGM